MKNIFASKTVWFNVLAGVIGMAQSQGWFTLIPDPYGPAVIAVVNVVLRYITVQPVAFTGKSLTGPTVQVVIDPPTKKLSE